MNRDEILQRSRAEKEDEGNTFLENRGRRFGVVGFCTMYILLVVFNFATGQSPMRFMLSSGAIQRWMPGGNTGPLGGRCF